MGLRDRLIAGISLLFLVLLSGLAYIYVVNTQGNLQAQLSAQSQDAATSLALRLALLGSLDDTGPVETTVNPVFDRGHFQEIRVLGPSGATLLVKRDPPAPDSAPEWFTRLLPIEPQGAQAIVSTGWRELGRVLVVSHPHFAYRQLWSSAVQMLGWLAVLYAVSLAGTWAFLAMVLKPMRDIEAAARAIAERDFRVIESVPSAPELARTVQALNSMSQRLQKIIAEETATANSLRKQALEDPVTGLFNREGFQKHMQAQIESSGEVVSGALALVTVDNFGPFNAQVGYQQGDQLLRDTAAALTRLEGTDTAFFGRLAGAGFALATLNTSMADAERLAEAARDDLWQLCVERDPGLAVHVGAVHWELVRPGYSALLGAVDAALQAARDKDKAAWHVARFDPEAPAGAQAWRAVIANALGADQVVAYAQDAFGLPGREVLHRELNARISRDGGGTIPAGQFLSLAARFDLIAHVDLRIVELAVRHLATQAASRQRLAVNISYRTLADEATLQAILRLLSQNPAAAAALVFEMTEFGALQDRAKTQAFRDALRARGASFALDSFSMLHDGLLLLHALRPDYVKVSRAYVAEIGRGTDVPFLFDALTRVMRPLDIALYALGVEDAAMLPLLAEHGISGYQGYAFGQPRPL
jgi:diguanylate cyclase (GGDEF)-like protein